MVFSSSSGKTKFSEFIVWVGTTMTFFFYKNSVISSKDNMDACPIRPYRRHAVASLRSFPPFQPLFQLSDIMLHKFWENDFAAPWVQGS